MGGPGTVTRDGLAACSETTGALLPMEPGRERARVFAHHIGATIYAGGNFTTLGGKARKNIGAVTTSGAVTSFNPGASDTVYVVRVGPNGNIFAGGTFSAIRRKDARQDRRGHARPGALVSWNVSIGQVTGFACPPRCHPVVFTIGFSGLDRLLRRPLRHGERPVAQLGGRGQPRHRSSCCSGIRTSTPRRTARRVRPSRPSACTPSSPTPTTGEVYACGGFWQVNGNKRSFNLAAFDPTTGALDPHFTVQDDGDTPGCALHNGVLYFGGHFNYVGVGCQHTTVRRASSTTMSPQRTSRPTRCSPGIPAPTPTTGSTRSGRMPPMSVSAGTRPSSRQGARGVRDLLEHASVGSTRAQPRRVLLDTPPGGPPVSPTDGGSPIPAIQRVPRLGDLFACIGLNSD